MENIYEIYNSTFVQTLFLTKSDIDEFKISMKNIKDQYLENNEEEIDVMRKCIRTSMKILFTSLNIHGLQSLYNLIAFTISPCLTK